MAERGAEPQVPGLHRRAMHSLRGFFTPLLPDDYVEMINPLWSTQELRGRIVSVDLETSDAATILIKPGWKWPGHRPGQYLRIGVVVDGVHHWRAYSLTSDPDRSDGYISITPKLVDTGKVSPYFVRQARVGGIVRLGGVEGTFVLPDEVPENMLFISAGSGITPVMSMLRSLEHTGDIGDVVHVHSARTEAAAIFGDQLRGLDERQDGYRLELRLTSEQGRFAPEHLDDLCPDWRERETFACGPAEMLDALSERWERDGDPERLHMERFQPIIGEGDGKQGDGGTIRFTKSDVEAESDGSQPILVAGEDAGVTLPFGCRMGICHTCVGELRSGQVRDLRTGKVSGSSGEMIRTCVNAPEGAVEIAL
jgi:stearoyl-CoA 9-desaturase NADPH oxidoreductase